MQLGEKIIELRKKKNMTQEELASIMNVARQSVSKWENNETVPELSKLIDLSKLFNVSLDYLIMNKKEEKNKNKFTLRIIYLIMAFIMFIISFVFVIYLTYRHYGDFLIFYYFMEQWKFIDIIAKGIFSISLLYIIYSVIVFSKELKNDE